MKIRKCEKSKINHLSSPWLALILITLVAAVIYSNIYGCPFIFDDTPQIVEKAKIRDIGNYFSLEQLLKPRAIVDLTFALNCKFGKLNVFGYHLVNILIHIINGYIVYLLSLVVFKQLFLLSTPRFPDSLAPPSPDFPSHLLTFSSSSPPHPLTLSSDFFHLFIRRPDFRRPSHPDPGGYLYGAEVRLHGGHVLYGISAFLHKSENMSAKSKERRGKDGGQRSEDRNQKAERKGRRAWNRAKREYRFQL